MTSPQDLCGSHMVLQHHPTIPLTHTSRGPGGPSPSCSPVPVESLKLISHGFNWYVSRNVCRSCEQRDGFHKGRGQCSNGCGMGKSQGCITVPPSCKCLRKFIFQESRVLCAHIQQNAIYVYMPFVYHRFVCFIYIFILGNWKVMWFTSWAARKGV